MPKGTSKPATEQSDDQQLQILQGLLSEPGRLDPWQTNLVQHAIAEGTQGITGDIDVLLREGATGRIRKAVANRAGDVDARSRSTLFDPELLRSIPESKKKNFYQKLQCYNLTDGATGYNLRQQLIMFRKYTTAGQTPTYERGSGRDTGRRFAKCGCASAFEGLITLGIAENEKAFAQLFRAIEEENAEETDRLVNHTARWPLSEDLVRYLHDPAALYERVVLECQMMVRQTVEVREWQKAGGGTDKNTLEKIQGDPKAFVASLVERRRGGFGQTYIDETWDQATPNFREHETLGIPEFDVPLFYLQECTPEQRIALLHAFQNVEIADEDLEIYRANICRSLEVLEQSMEGNEDNKYSIAYISKSPKRYTTDIVSRVRNRKNPNKKDQRNLRKQIPGVFMKSEHHALAKDLLDTIGYIPHDLYGDGSQPIKEVGMTDLIGLHEMMKSLQEDELNTYIPGWREKNHELRILNARSQLLSFMITSGTATKMIPEERRKESMYIDGTGLRLHLRDSSGNRELHAHIPYAAISDELCVALRSDKWMSDREIRELQLERARRNNDFSTIDRLETTKAKDFADRLGIVGEVPSLAIAERMSNTHSRTKMMMEMIDGSEFPASSVEVFLDVPTDDEFMERVYTMFRMAESAEQKISDAHTDRHTHYTDNASYLPITQSIISTILTELDKRGVPGVGEQSAANPFRCRLLGGSGKVDDKGSMYLISMVLPHKEATLCLRPVRMGPRQRNLFEKIFLQVD